MILLLRNSEKKKTEQIWSLKLNHFFGWTNEGSYEQKPESDWFNEAKQRLTCALYAVKKKDITWTHAQPRNPTSTCKLQYAINLSLLLFVVLSQYVWCFFFFSTETEVLFPIVVKWEEAKYVSKESKLLVRIFPFFIISFFVWLTLLSYWGCCVRCLELTLSTTEWIQCRKFH